MFAPVRCLPPALLSLLICLSAFGCRQSDATAQAHVSSLPSPPEPQALTYLLRDSSLREQLVIEPDRMLLYADSLSRAMNQPEAVIFKEEYAWFREAFSQLPFDTLLKIYEEKGAQRLPTATKQVIGEGRKEFVYGGDSLQPLKGLRVAIDPGHTAGNDEIAEIEGKYVKMRPARFSNYEPINFWEANLTLGTAHLIRQELERLGAEVFLTRSKPGLGALGMNYEEWKLTDEQEIFIAEELARGKLDSAELHFWRNEAEEKARMSRFFTQQDLRERARQINEFGPHLSLIIHFNIHGPSWDARDKQGYLHPEKLNYLMAFVPGSFLAGELGSSAERLSLLRLLLTEDLPESIRLSEAFVQESVVHTGVPIVSPSLPLTYLHTYSMLAEEGVYARNLSLTRMVHGPLVYGESLCQESVSEAARLNKKDLEVIPGLWVSSRLQEVADAYVSAVKAFVPLD